MTRVNNDTVQKADDLGGWMDEHGMVRVLSDGEPGMKNKHQTVSRKNIRI